MKAKTGDAKFTTTRRTDKLEGEIVNLQKSVEALTAVVTDMRAKVLPVPVDLLGRQRQSPVVRNAVGMFDG